MQHLSSYFAVLVVFCLAQLVCGELVPPTVTEVPHPLGVQEHEYHWWDVFTSRAAEYLGPVVNDAEKIGDRAQRSAAKAGEYITSNAAEYGEQVKDNAENLAENAKTRVGLFGHRVKTEGEHLGRQVTDNAENLAEHAKTRVGFFGHRVKNEAEHLGRQVTDNAEDLAEHAKDRAGQFGRTVKKEGRRLSDQAQHAGMAAHERINTQGQRVMRDAGINGGHRGVFGWIYDRIVGQAQSTAKATRGTGGNLRAELTGGMQRLGDMLGSIGQGASPSWPEAVFEGTKDPMFTSYIHELGQVSKQTNEYIQQRLDAHSELLEHMVGAHVSAQLPLASTYVPILALLLVYLINSVWSHKTTVRRRAHQQANGTDVTAARAARLEYELVSDAVSSAYAYLGFVPMATVLLVVMEQSGMAGWLIASSYTTLIAGTVAAGQPAFLVNVWSSDDIACIGQRLAIGITTVDAACCFIHAVFG
ncbi:hypothetical protein GGH19_002309 [Coemansia sp. RSA 1807]|nr:hypothetical protein GGH19_002309 [Coemansia sp. RSA 1807]